MGSDQLIDTTLMAKPTPAAGANLWGILPPRFFLINLRKILIAWKLSEFDPGRGAQDLENKTLRYQSIDFKELDSSVRLSCDGYCEAIVSIWICGAQGQMSQDLAGWL